MTVYKNDSGGKYNLPFQLNKKHEKFNWKKTTHFNLFWTITYPSCLKPAPLSIFIICDSEKAEWHSLILINFGVLAGKAG